MTRLDLRSPELLAARAPRYTSYPPATRFSPEVGPNEPESWLRAIPAGSRVSVYLHVPFCRRLCWFCACRTQGTRTDGPLAAYVETLEREIELIASRLPPGMRASQIHFGGGTPTLLPPALIERLGRALAQAFPLAPRAEVSVEIDPTVLDADRLDAFAAIGMNRASIGVQDFDPAVQAAIGRPQGEDVTQAAIDDLRARGVTGINLDLLYGLPRQTQDSFRRTLDAVAGMEPTRLALYGYAHVPWMSKRQALIDEASLPGVPERLALFEKAEHRLASAGYDRIGIDHFARPGDAMHAAALSGRLKRNFQGYTTDRAGVLIGLGASSISRFPQGFAQNAPATADWTRAVRAGRLATVRGIALTEDDRLRGEAIERFLCDLALIPERLSVPAFGRRIAWHLLSRWPDALANRTDGGVELRPDARHLARLVAMEMDAYAVEPGRHSIAV